MTQIKHPFDYLTEADHARIERWLSHPSPSVKSAVEILGLDEKKLVDQFDEGNGVKFRRKNLFSIISKLVKSALAIITRFFKPRSSAFPNVTKPVITITPSSNTPINDIYSALLEQKIVQSNVVTRIRVFRGRSNLTAFGDPPIKKIQIHFDSNLYDLRKHIEFMEIFDKIIDTEGGAHLDDQEVRSHFEKYSGSQ